VPDGSPPEDSKRQLAWWLENRLRGGRDDRLAGGQLKRLLNEAKTRGLDVSWQSVYRWASVSPSFARGAQFLAPAYVVEFIADHLASCRCERILDPWSAGGFLAASLIARGGAHSAVAVALQRLEELEVLLPVERAVELVHGDPLDILGRDLGLFDAVACVPPFGMKPIRRELQSDGEAVELRAEPSVVALIEASQRLSHDGIGVAVLPRLARQVLIEYLPRFGFHISALIALPAETGFVATSIPLEVVLWSRQTRDSLFVGRLSSDGTNTVLAENLEARRLGEAPELGRLVAASGFVSFERLALDEQLEKYARRQDAEITSLEDIATVVNLGTRSADGGFVESANAIYVPLIGEGPAVTTLAELHIKAHNYVQLVLDPERALAEYVAGWLNSGFGLQARRAGASGFIPTLSKSKLDSVVAVLPSLASQASSANAHHLILELDQKLAGLRDGLWRDGAAADMVREELGPLAQASFQEWIESLPFPLASILRRYHVAATAEQRVEYLRRSFEATAQFIAIILLSGFCSEPDAFLLNRDLIIGRGYRAPFVGSFGNWLVLAERLAKRVRQAISGKDPDERAACLDLFGANRPRLVEDLTSKDLYAVLNVAKDYRDRWEGHGGAADEAEWARRAVLFEAELGRLRHVLADAFEGWALVQPGGFNLDRGVYTGDVECLTGSNIMFGSRPVHLIAPMDRAHLYLVDLASEWPRPLRILPFVRMGPVPRSEDRACYFYSRVLNPKDGEILWISHHFKSRSEDTTYDPGLVELVASLDTSPGGARSD
jgi:hypothetical protein